MKVYRLEHATTGLGPWAHTSNKSPSLYRLMSDLGRRHFGMTEDFPDYWKSLTGIGTGKYYCGVQSLDHVDMWFKLSIPKFRKQFAANDYVLRAYEVDEEHVKMGMSGKQVFFIKDCAKLVEETLLESPAVRF